MNHSAGPMKRQEPQPSWEREKERALSLSDARSKAYNLENDPRNILKERCWKPVIVEAVLERGVLRRLTDPQGAWDYLRWIPEMLDRVPVGPGKHAFPSEVARDSCRLRALSLIAESADMARIVGPAEDAFSEARRLFTGTSVFPWAAAEYCQRAAAMAARAGDLEIAEFSLDQALGHAGDHPSPELLLVAGILYGPQDGGLPLLVRSQRRLNTLRRFPKLLARCALAHLVKDLFPPKGLADSKSFREIHGLFEADEIAGNCGSSWPVLYRKWAFGLVQWGLDAPFRTVAAPLQSAWNGFRKLRKERPAALRAGLDLATYYAVREEPEEASRVLLKLADLLPNGEEPPWRDTPPTPELLATLREDYPLPGLSLYPLGPQTEPVPSSHP